ncbi:hypothetical protein [Deinococcus multiflagellatus]|uniref:Uncharacterized protein n=1 Tax=Deinococcus multiflagellatus TaxID=1656887 RepID=A0ABW1ZR74_9DEIO
MADQAFIVLGAAGTYQEGSWPDVFWALGATLFAAASFRPPQEHALFAPLAALHRAALFLPYVALAAAFALLIATHGAPGPAARGCCGARCWSRRWWWCGRCWPLWTTPA